MRDLAIKDSLNVLLLVALRLGEHTWELHDMAHADIVPNPQIVPGVALRNTAHSPRDESNTVYTTKREVT